MKARIAVLLMMMMMQVVAMSAAFAQMPIDPLGQVVTLPERSPHWVWVNDIVFDHMSDGQAHLVDGDTGKYLGKLSTGFGFVRVVIPRDGKVIYSPETYMSRGTRGQRTDVVTRYDARTLLPLGETVIPPKRASSMPMMANVAITDDDRFLLIYNFNPSQSVTVVDTRSNKFVGEIETAGCALIYPTGPRSFFSICADGALLDVRLDESGKAARQQRTASMFDVKSDPVTEKAVRVGDTWLFVSFAGFMHPVRMTATGLTAEPKWALLTAAERAQNWRPGGLQQLAVHAGFKRLYALVQQGGAHSHKDPGKDVWVYDLTRKVSVQRIALKNLTTSIHVSADQKPLLFASFLVSSTTDIYDAIKGNHLRSIENVGASPTLLMSP